MKLAKPATALTALLLIAACDPAMEDIETTATNEVTGQVAVDLRVRDNPEDAYRSVDAFTVPASHEIGDGMMPYEGIGWENELVGYRMYLDGRLVSDIFGKRVGEPVLAQIGEYGSYHELADWGMDTLKVGPSLGMGGLGIMRDGAPAQFGAVPELSANIVATGGAEGRFTVTAGGIDLGDGATGGFAANYMIASGSPMTLVNVEPNGDIPLATGIVMHDPAEFWQSAEAGDNPWRYLATWGAQSENKDGLGMALFYRADQASYGGLANETHYVAFEPGAFEYGFLAAWELDPQGITSREEFTALLEAELARLGGMGE